jgi:single-strand DNA-binding protein
VAVNRSFTNGSGDKVRATDFFDVTVWRELAENVVESLQVGARVIVTGHLSQDRWEDEEGRKRSKVYVTATDVAPSLRWATAQVTRTRAGSSSSQMTPDD